MKKEKGRLTLNWLKQWLCFIQVLREESNSKVSWKVHFMIERNWRIKWDLLYFYRREIVNCEAMILFIFDNKLKNDDISTENLIFNNKRIKYHYYTLKAKQENLKNPILYLSLHHLIKISHKIRKDSRR